MDTREELCNIIEHSRSIIDSLPGLILIKDINSVYVDCNDDFCSVLKFDRKKIIGCTDYDLSWEKYASVYQQYDRETLAGEELTTLVPLLIRDGNLLTSRTYKKPILNSHKQPIGILGQANILSNNILSKSLYILNAQDNKETALSGYTQKSYKVTDYNQSLNFTNREAECLFLTIRGKSAKEIAKFLSISARTAEGYIENIKNKLQVTTKSELISKSIEMGLMDVIPRGEILTRLCNDIDKWRALF